MFGKIQELIQRKKSPLMRRLGYLLKLLFTVLLLAWILHKVDVPTAFSNASTLPLLSALAILLLSVLRHFIQCVNWRCALHLNEGYSYNRRELISSYLVALPLRFVIPGGHASLAKVFYLKNTSLLASLVSTMTERLFMSWATWTFAAIATFFIYPQFSLALRLILILVAAFLPLWAALIMGIGKGKVHQPAFLRQAPRMMLLQIANTLLMYLQYYIVLNHLGKISAIGTWLGISLTNLANSIPITISGLGLREGFAIHFLEGFNFSSEAAVAATLSVFFFHDLLSAAAGAVVLFRSKKLAGM